MNISGEKILPTKCTPSVSFSPEGVITIRGRSMKENVSEFSKQAESWIDAYVNDPADLTCVDFYLEYLDGMNIKTFVSLVKKIASLKSENKEYIINWHYEEGDEDILEKGECIASALDVSFNFIEIFDSGIHECGQQVLKIPQTAEA